MLTHWWLVVSKVLSAYTLSVFGNWGDPASDIAARSDHNPDWVRLAYLLTIHFKATASMLYMNFSQKKGQPNFSQILSIAPLLNWQGLLLQDQLSSPCLKRLHHLISIRIALKKFNQHFKPISENSSCRHMTVSLVSCSQGRCSIGSYLASLDP